MVRSNKKIPFYLGIYATSPCIFNWNQEKEKEFILAMSEIIEQCDGLEMPYWATENIHPHDMDFYKENYNPTWSYILTLIPGNMKKLAQNPHFGLCSNNEEGRKEAIAYYKMANQLFLQMTQGLEKRKIPFVQLVTSPSFPVSGVSRSADALYTSLKEVLAWNWGQAKLTIEHCDSADEKGDFQKGFLPIKEEIQIIKALDFPKSKLGLTVNWGRSAIETKSANGPLEHIKIAKSEGVLSGLIFSGAAETGKHYGNWKDLHAPVQTSLDGVEICSDSILTLSELSRVAQEITSNDLDYLGLKILVAPAEEVPLSLRVKANDLSIKAIRGIVNL